MQKYEDPATELPVVRLTDPAFASGLTSPDLRQFVRRTESLLCWSDRAGSTQGFLQDLRSGESRQITDAASLDRTSLSLAPDEKSVYFFDGDALSEAGISGSRPHVLYQIPAGAARKGMTVAADGSIFFAEGPRVMRVLKGHAAAVAEDRDVDLVLARPRRPEIAVRSAGGFALMNLDGSGKRQIALAPGTNAEWHWTPSGRSLIYLHIPEDPKQLISLRENVPEEGTDREIARTSQFASVSANGDASVFAGASRSKASAYVLVLLRVTRRELTICEHRASDPRMVSPVFSPDSQSLFFVSDRHGKAAIYRVRLDKFVEATGDESHGGGGERFH